MSQRQKIQTSVDAYKSLVPEQLTDTYKGIIAALKTINEGTFEDISAVMKVDKSVVWKRLSELASMQIIYRPGNKRMLKSGRNGYTWMLCNPDKTEKDVKFSREAISKTKPIEHYAKNINQISKTVQTDMFASK